MRSKPWPLARGDSPLTLLLLLFTLAGVATSVQAQWVWRDAGGEVTYSDSPPPANVTRSDILRTPGGGASSGTRISDATPSDTGGSTGSPASAGTGGSTSPAQPAATPTAPASKPDTTPKSLAEKDADFKKRLAEQQKAEQKQAEEETQSAERSNACTQAKSYMEMLQGGTRLLRPDANGDRNFLDDDQRTAEEQKTQDLIDKNC